MHRYLVYIEIEGAEYVAGYLICDANSTPYFVYDPEFVRNPAMSGISLSLPKRIDAYSAEETKNFFEGLLPEGFARRTVADWLHVEASDYISILSGLGKECLGAIRILEENEPPRPSHYEKISSEEIKALAAEGATKSTQILVKTHLSLTGASGKVGLYLSEQNEWYFPTGSAPSTHIVKQSHVRFSQMVANETLALRTAERLGVKTVQHAIVNAGGTEDEHILFATKRYDREIDSASRTIDGLKTPYRLHQEDFCQALGISSERKYEHSKSGYAGKMAEIIRRTSQPLIELQSLYRMLVINFLLGNNDGHLKNFSLLYDKTLKNISLAPAYDMVSTVCYDGTTDCMSLFIGEHNVLQEITREDFMIMAEEMKLGKRVAGRIIDECVERFEMILREESTRLFDEGYREVYDLRDRILQKGGHFGT